jgi:hypothetical protein
MIVSFLTSNHISIKQPQIEVEYFQLLFQCISNYYKAIAFSSDNISSYNYLLMNHQRQLNHDLGIRISILYLTL